MNAIILWHPAGSRNIDPSVKLFSQSLRANMASRTPSPDYMYEGRFPTVVPDGDMDGRAAPVFFLVIYEQPLASSGRHPEELGTFLVAGANMGAPLRREVHGFVGWLLELLLLPPQEWAAASSTTPVAAVTAMALPTLPAGVVSSNGRVWPCAASIS